jgi:hypothetical protein
VHWIMVAGDRSKSFLVSVVERPRCQPHQSILSLDETVMGIKAREGRSLVTINPSTNRMTPLTCRHQDMSRT